MFRKVDDHTLQIEFSGPNTLVINYFSGGAELYPWRPAHYLKQFHQDYADAATLSAMVKDRGFELWNQLFQFHGSGNAWKVDPDVPTLRPWVRTTAVDQAIIFERNPYYWKIDTAGNQLPYMDRSFVDVVSDVEVYKAKAQSGEIDRGDRGLGAKDLALYVANASANNYQVGLIRQFAAGSPGVFFNMNYPHSEPLRMLFRGKGLPRGDVAGHQPRRDQRGVLPRPRPSAATGSAGHRPLLRQRLGERLHGAGRG